LSHAQRASIIPVMPTERLGWVHVIINTRRSWLHGDKRGFRARRHAIHSGGDYRHRPPETEHEGLREYHAKRAHGKPVSFRLDVRIRILRSFVIKMRSLGYRIIACSVGEEHLHALVELPRNYTQTRAIVGKCKQKASHAVRDVLPGSLWSSGGEYKQIRDVGHLHNVYRYIRTRQERGTVVWSHHDDENWIDTPQVGIVLMGIARKQLRIECPDSSVDANFPDAGV
jgi:REP element-mobilizing transposase RayT